MNLEQYYDQLWAQRQEELKQEPKPEQSPAVKDLTEQIAELEKIYKRN
jgi:hypothetical protein